jgi:hypothetical protein
VLDNTGVNPSNVIAGATVSTFAAEKVLKPSPTSLFGRALPWANRLLRPAALGYEGYDRYTRGQNPGEIATIMGSGLVGMQAGAIGGAKLGGAAGFAVGGPPGAAIGGAIGGFVGGGLGYWGSEYAAERMLFSDDSTGDKLNQESVEASGNNKTEVHNITLPPEQVSQPAQTPPQKQSSSPGIGDVPGCDRSLPETLDCKF